MDLNEEVRRALGEASSAREELVDLARRLISAESYNPPGREAEAASLPGGL